MRGANRIWGFLILGLFFPLTEIPVHAQSYQVEILASGLDLPWSIAEIGNGKFLITEKTGQLLMIDSQGNQVTIQGTPQVHYANQGGLLEVMPHPQFAYNQQVYLSYSSGDQAQNQTTVARGTLINNRLSKLEVILEAKPQKKGGGHFGGRLAFLPDDTLLVSIGDGFSYREQAQNLENEFGTLLRVNPDGSPAEGNPFPEKAPRIYSYGHRNPQGLVFDPGTGRILMHEHGPKGGDELNHIRAGLNYGWPAITFGIDYSGAMISPFTEADGMEQPLTYWVPSIGPSGLAVYSGDDFPEWEGDLLLGSLINGEVLKLEIENAEIIAESTIFPEVSGRVRDIRVLAEGSIVVVTDEGIVTKFSRAN